MRVDENVAWNNAIIFSNFYSRINIQITLYIRILYKFSNATVVSLRFFFIFMYNLILNYIVSEMPSILRINVFKFFNYTFVRISHKIVTYFYVQNFI